MKVYSLKEVKPSLFVKPVITTGVYDGFHLGHQEVIRKLTRWAREVDGESVVLTFRRHPRQILREHKIQKKEPRFIFTLRHRLLHLARAHVDKCVILPLTRRFASITAEEFVRNIICKKIAPVGVLMGYDSRFGRDGAGDDALLRRVAPECGFLVRTCRQMKVGTESVGSTLVRTLVASGEIERASRLLGRPVSVLGTVVRGSARGASLGFPTANLNLHRETMPPAGVWAGEARVNPFSIQDSRVYPALINIGARPTFRGRKERVEVHLIGFSGNLYGSEIEVSFIKRLRDERRFLTSQALCAQLEADRDALLALTKKRRG